MALAAPDLVPGFAAADYSARMRVTCVACGSAAVMDGRDYCDRCQYVATLIRVWGTEQVIRRVWQVAPTLPGAALPPGTPPEGIR